MIGTRNRRFAWSSASRLPLCDGPPNVFTLRDAGDAVAIRQAITPGARLIVVGAGFIGQEVASTARRLGAEVTILEAMPQPLTAILGEQLGSWFAELHREEGFKVLCSTIATDLEIDAEGRVVAVTTDVGSRLVCDAVVVGIGVAAADEWLASSELEAGVRGRCAERLQRR